jgi:hypothetical protein
MPDYIEAWLEEDDGAFDYELIREVLSPENASLTEQQINALLEDVLSGMSPEEAGGFWNTLKDFGKKAAPIAGQILPVAAPIIGTAIGGPLGGAAGGALGQIAGQALTGTASQKPPMSGPATQGTPFTQVQAPIPAGGSSATAQLMAFLQNPALLQSILGQILGPAGRSSVPVGQQGTLAPFGAFMNALSALANQAAVEVNARITEQEDAETIPEYLLGNDGKPLCDLAVPEERAQCLLERLRESYFDEAEDEEDELTEWFRNAGWT